MPRIDDFINAKKLSVEALCQESFDAIVLRSGFEAVASHIFKVPFLDQVYHVDYPEFNFENQGDTSREVPIQEQILILHYMEASGGKPLTEQLVSYREIPGASFYFAAFLKRAVDPIKKVFGYDTTPLAAAVGPLGGEKIEAGDAGYEFQVFPAVPLQLILYTGDDEFPPEANILFDENIEQILPPEDIAWMAGMVVYRLIALAK